MIFISGSIKKTEESLPAPSLIWLFIITSLLNIVIFVYFREKYFNYAFIFENC